MEFQSQRRLIVWILGALATVSPLAIDLYLPAFDELALDFKTTQAAISLSVTSYFIGMALGQILYGPLLDRFGRKLPLYAGLLLFILASLGCMISRNTDTLVAFRFVQALGGSVAWVAAVAMVRDFFPVEASARIFSLLVLILGVSPLLGPTAGGFIATAWGWRSVFAALACIGLFVLLLVRFFLPEGQKADASVSLRFVPLARTFFSILKEPQFYTYAFAGAFSFATLFIYVAASPMIFMQVYKLPPQQYGIAFALLSVGFISASQINVVLGRFFSAEKLFRSALFTQALTSALFLTFALNGILNLYTTFAFLFICMACIGLNNPNATALAIAPFSRNLGSASALLGFIQIGVSAIASTGVAILGPKGMAALVALLTFTTLIAVAVLLLGRMRITAPLEGAPVTGAGH